jgi:hypothetical protein
LKIKKKLLFLINSSDLILIGKLGYWYWHVHCMFWTNDIYFNEYAEVQWTRREKTPGSRNELKKNLNQNNDLIS